MRIPEDGPPEIEEAGSHQTPSCELLSLQKREKQMSAVNPHGVHSIFTRAAELRHIIEYYQ